MKRMLPFITAAAIACGTLAAQSQESAGQDLLTQSQFMQQCDKLVTATQADIAPQSDAQPKTDKLSYDDWKARLKVACHDVAKLASGAQATQLHDWLAAATANLEQTEGRYVAAVKAGYAPKEMLSYLIDQFKKGAEAELNDKGRLAARHDKLSRLLVEVSYADHNRFEAEKIPDLMFPIFLTYGRVVEPADYLDPVINNVLAAQKQRVAAAQSADVDEAVLDKMVTNAVAAYLNDKVTSAS